MHFSEDPTIESFAPRRSATQQIDTIHVWAVDAFHAPSYWFPRQCPRALAWTRPTTDPADSVRLLGPGRDRVHVIELDWLDRLRTTRLYAYRLDAASFRPVADDGHAHVCDHAVESLGPPDAVGDLVALHQASGIELRTVDNVWPFWATVSNSSLGFSGIRLANAKPATEEN